MKRLPFLLLLLFLPHCSQIQGLRTEPGIISEVREIKDLKEIKETIATLPSASTLVVYDMDDTLLTADHFFGSDRWYDWQRGRGNLPVPAEAKPQDLWKTIGYAFEMGSMSPTQPETKQIFSTTQPDTMILTARGNDYRSATLRDLRANNLPIDDEIQLKGKPASQLFTRFPMVSGSGREAVVEFSSGVFMVAGMDKGKALLQLWEKLGISYDHVILIDDKMKNITNMQNALKEANVDYYGFHYTRIDKTIHPKDVKEGISALKKLEMLLNTHFH